MTPERTPNETPRGVTGSNRRKVMGFLYYYSDLWEIGSGDSSDSPDGLGRANSPATPDTLLRGYVMSRADARTDHPEASISFAALTHAVDVLKRERWHLYNRLEPLYFRQDNNPTRLDHWYAEAGSGSKGARIALGDHREAVEFIQKRAEAYLLERGVSHLVMDLPVAVRGHAAQKMRKKRQRATDTFVGHLAHARNQGLTERQARARAVRFTARETGYSVQEVRTLARRVEAEVHSKPENEVQT